MDNINIVDKTPIHRTRERNTVELMKIKTEDENEYVLKRINEDKRFKNSITALENLDFSFMPNPTSINKEKNEIILPFYKGHNMIWEEEDKIKNFLKYLSDYTERIHKVDIPDMTRGDSEDYLDNFLSSTIKDVRISYPEYLDVLKSICSELRQYTFDFKPCHLDPHEGNYIISSDCDIKYIIDWEKFGYHPVSYEYCKIYSRILMFNSYFCSYDLSDLFFSESNYNLNEKVLLWSTAYQIRTTAKSNNRGPVKKNINNKSNINKDAVSVNEELTDRMIKDIKEKNLL
jgi:thiamine kinase-like enzyme